jgi:hypothetical protein
VLAKVSGQIGVFAKALDQDGAGTVERARHIRHLLVGIDVAGRDGLRIVLRLRQQKLGQRLEAGLPGDLGLGPALRLVRQIDVFQPSLAVGGKDGRLQRGIELALFTDRIEDRGAAGLELAQIVQPLLQRAQLRVVEPAGDFLAVPRHERHGGAAIKQRHGRLDLLLANAKLLRNLSMNICHVRSSCKQSAATESSAARTPLMDHDLSTYQPGSAKKLICGSPSFDGLVHAQLTTSVTGCMSISKVSRNFEVMI